jgi:hypothetical protein
MLLRLKAIVSLATISRRVRSFIFEQGSDADSRNKRWLNVTETAKYSEPGTVMLGQFLHEWAAYDLNHTMEALFYV